MLPADPPDVEDPPDVVDPDVVVPVLATTDGVEEYTAAAATPAVARLPTLTATVMPLAKRLPLLRIVMTGSPPLWVARPSILLAVPV